MKHYYYVGILTLGVVTKLEEGHFDFSEGQMKPHSRNDEIEELLEAWRQCLETPEGTSALERYGETDGANIYMYYKYRVDSCLENVNEDEHTRYGRDLTAAANAIDSLLELCFDRSSMKVAKSQKLWLDCVEALIDEEYEEVLGWINCLPYEDYLAAIFTRDQIAATLYCGKLFGPWEVSVDIRNTLSSLDEKFKTLIPLVDLKDGAPSYSHRRPFYFSKSSHWWCPDHTIEMKITSDSETWMAMRMIKKAVGWLFVIVLGLLVISITCR